MLPKRLLFLSEDVTLAQVVRLVLLAKSIQNEPYEVHFACSAFPALIFHGTKFHQHILSNIGSKELLAKTLKGQFPYTEKVLESYIKDEIALFDIVRPDLIIGDFRLSLTISAPYCKIPLAVLINSYWIPYYPVKKYPLPDHSIIELLGEKIASLFYPLALPFVFDSYASPINKIRKKYGLTKIGSLQQVLTFGDFVLYPDPEGLIPLKKLPENHYMLGGLLWSPPTPMPPIKNPEGLPIIYITLGSSGNLAFLTEILQSMKELPVLAIVATAGRVKIRAFPDNVTLYEYLPGEEITKIASVVICNGGSTTAYQALAAGVPIIGIPSNLDQYLSMEIIQKQQAGILLKARKVKVPDLQKAILKILKDPTYKINALRVKGMFDNTDYRKRFHAFLKEAIGCV